MEPNLAHPDPSHFSTETKDLMDVAQVSDVPKYHGMLARRIHQLECELWALRSCHNAVTLTCRLPPEILARIFIDLASMGLSAWYTLAANKKPRKVSVSWLRVTFVCRHWRSVALQSPSLWSNLVFSNANLAEAMLTRSKGAPLTIWYNGMKDKPSSVLTTALSSVDRLRSVKFSLDKDSYIQPALLAWAQKTGPTLTSFEMSYDIGNSGSLPKAFLRASSHSLRILSLIRCGYTWGDLPIGPRITHLSLDSGHMFSDTHRPTHSMFAYSLQQMPHLQCFNLIGFLPSEADTQYPEPIHIPSLRSLSLEDDARIIEVSLRILRFPREARIDLNPWYFDDTNNIAERVGQTLRGLRGFVPANRAFRKLSFHLESQIFRDAAHFEFFFEEGVDESLAGPCLTLSFNGHLVDFLPDYVSLIYKYLDIPDSMTLHLKGYLRMSIHTLRTTLGRIPQLNTVTFEEVPFRHVPKLLTRPVHSDGTDGTYASSDEGGCFPGLTIINFVALDMGALHGQDEVIVSMLDGHAVHEVNFRNCTNIQKKCFEMMKETLPSVLFSCDTVISET
ncbi:hypothetical protein D9611_002792 [Ephemerocybe angulata]|uniref:F-box domain-containing protein n=1 Tax=Ephemerocybe angulata TaxID=980116 RepID=A0A8H5FDY2_9AGAR|nr:hypothetical protein D9611_002792 [Tulosesus angulatus]